MNQIVKHLNKRNTKKEFNNKTKIYKIVRSHGPKRFQIRYVLCF